MDENHRKILQKHRVLLRRELSAEEVATHLFTDEVFDQEDVHEVNVPSTPERRVDALLEILPRKGPQAFSAFYKSLKSTREDLASKLLTPFSELNLEERDSFSNAALPCYPYNFTGRDNLCKEIVCKVKDGFKLLPIVAPPGYGKSDLACVIGHLLKQEDCLVLFFELKEITTVYSIAVLILEKLEKIPCTKPVEQLQNFLAQLPRKTVLILDNSEHVQANENQKFFEFLVNIGKYSEMVYMIVTTTLALGNLRLLPFPAQAFPLEPLNEEEAVKLWKKLNSESNDERSFNMRQLCISCMGIPIFLEVAASLVTIGTDIISLIEDLKSSPEVLLQEEQIACKMKVFLSCIPCELKVNLAKLATFPAEFSYNEMKFLIDIPGLQLRHRLAKLTDYSVLKFDKETSTYKLHSVVQSVVSKARLDDFLYQEYNKAVVQFVQHYMALLREMYVQFVSHNNMKALEHYSEHKRNILHAFTLAIEYKLVEAVDTSTEVINLLAKCLNIYEFETVYFGMAGLVKEDNKKYSDCMASIGFKYLCYHGTRNIHSAKRKLSEARQLQEACQSLDTEERAHTLSKLGLCLAHLGEIDEGERLIRQGISIREKLLEKEGNNIRKMLVAGGYCDLGMAFTKQSKFSDSIKIWEQMSLATYQEILGIHPFTATLLQYIGDAYHQQGLYQQALQKKQESLEMRTHLLTEYHQDTARSYAALAKTLEALGRSEEAVEMLEKTKHIQVKVLASPEDLRSTEFEIKRLTELLHNGVGR